MSRTTTLLAPQSVVMLSPSKKRLLDQESTQDVDKTKPTRNQLWRWCLRADAIAQCYIRDVMQLQVNAQENGYGMCSSSVMNMVFLPEESRFRYHLVAGHRALS